jgi:hypothetical protein
MLDNPDKQILAIRIRDCERRLLNARDPYEERAARVSYERALAALEEARQKDNRGG